MQTDGAGPHQTAGKTQLDPGQRRPLSRRQWLKSAVVGASTLLGAGVLTGKSAGVPPDVPTDNPAWTLVFEDDFDGETLNEDNWGIGWGWGPGAPGTKVSRVRERHVTVSDSMLRLTASHEDFESTGNIYVGSVNSKNNVTVSPPVYYEARCKFVDAVGWQNAFWSKPNSEAWPPEIDVVEYIHPDETQSDMTMHNLHYPESGDPGDNSTHERVLQWYEHDDTSPGEDFHVYGVAWLEDSIRHYVDGVVVGEVTDPEILSAIHAGGPQYLMLSMNIDNIGTSDKDVPWEDNEVQIDWVRKWVQTDS